MANWVDRLPPNLFRLGINLWPPLRCCGVKVAEISADFREFKVNLNQYWYNRNYVGTHFGGSMFSMADPFFMLILLKNLGAKYIVWDKAAKIEFIKPGKGTLSATFSFSIDELKAIREQADAQQKYIFDKSVEIFNAQGEVVARVVKTLFVKSKTLTPNSTV